MTEVVPIRYREFYDIPRLFIADYNGTQYLFDGGFDDARDDYALRYTVYALPRLSADELGGDWSGLSSRATRIVGTISTSELNFDETRRSFISSDVFKRITPASEHRGTHRGVA